MYIICTQVLCLSTILEYLSLNVLPLLTYIYDNFTWLFFTFGLGVVRSVTFSVGCVILDILRFYLCSRPPSFCFSLGLSNEAHLCLIKQSLRPSKLGQDSTLLCQIILLLLFSSESSNSHNRFLKTALASMSAFWVQKKKKKENETLSLRNFWNSSFQITVQG